MSRAAEKQAKDTYGQAKGIAGQAGANASGIYSALLPQYEKEAVAPEGFAPGELAKMETSAGQSIGGSTAGAVGRNNQIAAKTRNRGGFQTANDEAMREGARQLSSATLGIEGENARLKEQQRQAGLAGEAGLYGLNLNDQIHALGAEHESTDDLMRAGQSGWLQNSLGVLNTLSGMGKSAASLGAHF